MKITYNLYENSLTLLPLQLHKQLIHKHLHDKHLINLFTQTQASMWRMKHLLVCWAYLLNFFARV